MTDAPDIERFRARLRAAREEILALRAARDASSATVELDQTSVGRLSRIDALQQQAMALDGQRRAQAALQRIESALQRCEDGSFGYCVDCDQPIDPRRLEVDPATTLCVRCAEARGQ